MKVQLTRGTQPPPTPPPPAPIDAVPQDKSFLNKPLALDSFLVLFLAVAVWNHTPIGPFAQWLYHATTGTQPASISFPAILDHSKRHLAGQHSEQQPFSLLPLNIELSAKRTGGNPQLLTTIALTLGSCDNKICTLPKLPYLADILERPVNKPNINALELALAMQLAAEQLWDNEELALEALFVGPRNVRRAIHFARIAGKNHPESIEEHHSFFARHVSKDNIQRVRTILGNHRLRSLTWPAPASTLITSPFGMRTHPITKRRVAHNGIDIHANVGDPIVSVHHGKVIRTGRDALSGNYVKIDHGFGITSSYAHLDQILAQTGERLKRGTPIGRAGSTGRVTGPHLHFTLVLDGKHVDPQQYSESHPKRSKPIAVSLQEP